MRHLQVQNAIRRQIEWEPRLDSRNISVAVINGVVTMRGFVRLPDQRLVAEQAAKSVNGVRAVVNLLEVQPVVPDAKPVARAGSYESWRAAALP